MTALVVVFTLWAVVNVALSAVNFRNARRNDRAPADPWRALTSLLYALATAAWVCLPAVVVWMYRGAF